MALVGLVDVLEEALRRIGGGKEGDQPLANTNKGQLGSSPVMMNPEVVPVMTQAGAFPNMKPGSAQDPTAGSTVPTDANGVRYAPQLAPAVSATSPTGDQAFINSYPAPQLPAAAQASDNGNMYREVDDRGKDVTAKGDPKKAGFLDKFGKNMTSSVPQSLSQQQQRQQQVHQAEKPSVIPTLGQGMPALPAPPAITQPAEDAMFSPHLQPLDFGGSSYDTIFNSHGPAQTSDDPFKPKSMKGPPPLTAAPIVSDRNAKRNIQPARRDVLSFLKQLNMNKI